MDIRFVTWDFRTPPTAGELATAIRAFDGGPVYATAIDVGTDDYVLALATKPVTAGQAISAWQTQTD